MSWQNWNLSEWNEALIESVFFEEKHFGSKLSRIDASYRFLCKATKDVSCSPEEAKSKFLDSFGGTVGLVRWQFRWPGPNKLPAKPDVYPACFAALYLSLLAASADNETSGIGDFRQRFADILKFIEPHSVDLSGLPKMWEHVSQWSQLRFESKKDCAVLVIPKPAAHEKLIGISKRIAFPTYKDELFLRKILLNNNLSGDSAFSDVVKAVSLNIRNFNSTNFEDEFKIFFKYCHQGNYKEAYESPFWGAIKDISIEQDNENAQTKGINNLSIDISDLNEINFYFYIDETLNKKRIIPTCPLNFIRQDKCSYVAYVDNDYPRIQLIEKWINENPNKIGNRISKQIKSGWIVFFPDESGELSNEGSYYKDNQVALLIENTKSKEPEYYLKVNDLKYKKISNNKNFKDWNLFLFQNLNEEHLLKILNFAPNSIRNLTRIGWSPPKVSISNGARFGQFYLLNPSSNPLAQMAGAVKGSYNIKNSKNEILMSGELSHIDEKFQIPYHDLRNKFLDIDICEYILFDANQNNSSASIKITNHFIDIKNIKKIDQRTWLEDSKVGILNSENIDLNNFEIINNSININKEIIVLPEISIGNISEKSEKYKLKDIDDSQIWIGNSLALRFQKRNMITFDILKEHTIGVAEVLALKGNNLIKSLFYAQWLIPIINKDGPYTAIKKGDLNCSILKREQFFYLRLVGPITELLLIQVQSQLQNNESSHIYQHETGFSISCIEIKTTSKERAEEIARNIEAVEINSEDFSDPISAFDKNRSKVQRFNNSPLNSNLETWDAKDWKWDDRTAHVNNWKIGEIRRTTGKTRLFYWTKIRNDLFVKTDSVRWSWIFSVFATEDNPVYFSNNGHIYWHKKIQELPSSLTKWWMLFGGGCISVLNDGTTVFAGLSNEKVLQDMGWMFQQKSITQTTSIAQKRLKLALNTKLKKSKFKFL